MGKRLIGSVGLTPASDSGFDLDTKGQIHGYTSTQYALDVGNDSDILVCDSGEASGLKYTANTTSFVVACSDESTALTTGDAKVTWRMPYAYTVTAVRASLTGAGGSSGTTTVQIQEAGSDILSTPITIDYGDTTSVGASASPVIDDSSLADNAVMTVDIDAVTGDADETGLKIYIIGYRVAH